MLVRHRTRSPAALRIHFPLPYLLAPGHRRIVAIVAFLAGAAYAGAFVVAGLDAWPYAACAIASGLIVLVKTRPRAAH